MRWTSPIVLLALTITVCTAGCDGLTSGYGGTLADERAAHQTSITSTGPNAGAADVPPEDSGLEYTHYHSADVGWLAAYLTPDPGDGQRHPAIIWITGGDCNSIGDVWSPQPRDNDQSARAFREAGIITMYPSMRGGNDNPGRREGFYGEVDDVIAAADHLAALPYVDPDRIYLGGHSTGGTLVMLVAASSDRFRRTFALGPVARAADYGGRYLYCAETQREHDLRAPILWLDDIHTPLMAIEGGGGNADSIMELEQVNTNPHVECHTVSGMDHFNLIAPLTERLAAQIVSDSPSWDFRTVLYNLR